VELDDGAVPESEDLVGAETLLVIDIDADPVAEGGDVLGVVLTAGVHQEEVEAGVAELVAGRVEDEVAGRADRRAHELRGIAAWQREDDLDATNARGKVRDAIDPRIERIAGRLQHPVPDRVPDRSRARCAQADDLAAQPTRRLA